MLSAATLLAGACVVSLASCGESGDSTHTIKFYHTMGDSLQTVLATAITDFETKFPGWKVESSAVGGYDDVRSTVVADLTAGQQPDLAYCYADHVALYLESGKVVDMSEFVKNQEPLTVNIKTGDEFEAKTLDEIVGYTQNEVKDFVEGYYNEGFATNYADYTAYGFSADSLLTLPFVKSTEVLYYNADALEVCGLEVPETWEELWDACRTIRQVYKDCTPLGYDSEANWFITMCEQNGWGYTSTAAGDHYKFNNESTKQWLSDLKGLFTEKLFTTQVIYGSYTSNLFVKGAEDGSVFSIGSSGGANHQASNLFKWGVAPIPGTELSNGKINRSVISQGPSLVMLETSANNADEKKLMTWEFVKCLETPEFQCSFAMASGYNPSRKSSFDVPDYKRFLEGDSIVAKTALVGKEQTENYFTSPAFKGSAAAREQVGTALRYAVIGRKTPEKALEDAVKACGN